jgi:hypothetical protein
MRTLLRLGACAAILLALATPARSQGIFDRIKKKAEDAAAQKAEEKVSGKINEMAQKMVDNSFSSMFGDSAGGAGGAKGGKGGGLLFSINSNAKTEASYSFNVVTTMEIESSKQKDKAVLTTLYNTNEPYVGMKIVSPDDKKSNGTAFIVMDAKNQAMVMMMSTDTSKFSMAYGWSDAQKYAPPTSSAPREQVNWDTVKVWRNYTRIGTKTIAGYASDGYRMESPDGAVDVWVSHDRALAGGGMFGASSQLKQMRGRLPADYPQGMLMQVTSVNSKTGEKGSMTVTNIDTNAHVTYAMSDYPRLGAAKK